MKTRRGENLKSGLEKLKLAGTAPEIAYQLGKQRRKKIGERIEFWERHLAKIYRGKRNKIINLERSFFSFAKKYVPQFLEEIHAMAEGADSTFSEIFRLNLTELSSYVDKCTDLIWAVIHRGKKGVLIAHNEDWDPRRNDVFILQATLPKVSYQVLAYDGYLPGLSAGVNSYGLCHSVNYLRPLDFRIGVPRIFITRYLVTANGIDDALSFIKKIPRAFGQGIHLAKGSRYLGLELTARSVALLRPSFPAVHTNHYLSPKLHEKVPPPLPSSRIRHQTAERLLKKLQAPGGEMLTLKEAKNFSRKILSDRSGFPYAIWRKADHPKEGSATLAMAFVDTISLGMEVFRNNPELRPKHRR